MTRPRVVIIGGGIAGVSLAYFLAKAANVIVIEAEAILAYHATGRSAALHFESYGAHSIRPLTKASRTFLEDPPPGLTDYPLLAARGALTIASAERLSDLRDSFENGSGRGREWLDPSGAQQLCPVLDDKRLAAAVWEPDASDIDVAALHQAFVRGIRTQDGQILTDAPVTGLKPFAGSWIVTAGTTDISADIVVNAAGAWGDVIAELAGVTPIGIRPLRRTAFTTPAPDSSDRWPMVMDVDQTWYFKPDGSQLLCSPADQTPVDPHDARPDELAIAMAIDRINHATSLGIRTVRTAWAGLRTFAPDGGMVLGFDPGRSGFFWLVGQGGTGIQTSPGAGRLAASLIVGGEAPDDMPGLDLSALSPTRFRASAATPGS